jgi:hypothetical protein
VGFGGFGLKPSEDGLLVWASKPGVDGLGLKTIGRMVSGFGPQNPGVDSEEEQSGTWRNHRGCVKAKQICAGSVAVRLPKKEFIHYAFKLSGLAQNS